MERILNLLILAGLIIQPVSAVQANTIKPSDMSVEYVEIEKPYTDFSLCTKTFPVGVEKLFYLVLSAASDMGFNIKEIQSKGGYIVFETGYRKYLATVVYVSSTKSMLKITPFSGNYDFSPEVVNKVFGYIDKNINKSE